MAYVDNIAVFVRVIELGSLSAAGRDMHISPAVASNRVKELEKHLGVRLFNRTTRQLIPTEHGRVFYAGAKRVLSAVVEAEAAISDLTGRPRGRIRLTAPLGLGRRIIATGIPEFHDMYPQIEVRLRLSDHNVDIMKEGIDLAFKLGVPDDSSLRLRGIMECERILAAAPSYLERRGDPSTPDDIVDDNHSCLLLRFPGTRENLWTLGMPGDPRRIEVNGPLDCDDRDVLIGWAVAGRGIINVPRFEIASFIQDGRLRPILTEYPPTPVQLAAVYPHKRFQDPKIRLFLDFMVDHCQKSIREIMSTNQDDAR